MSFSAETKNSLCALHVKKRCCRTAMLYGMLLFSHTFSEKNLKMTTENERTSQQMLRLLSSCFGVKAELSISEKKARDGQRYNSYKISVPSEKDCQTIYSAFYPNASSATDDIKISREVFRCSECLRMFLRGAFLSAGSISDPRNSYHLDITANKRSIAVDFCDLLLENGIPSKHTFRKLNSIVYFKESEAIEDFLTIIGAANAALSVMNVAIYREIRNNENRRSNCDTANIYKITGTASKQLRAIKLLRSSGRFDSLDADLRETAEIREAMPDRSLQDLAAAHQVPISKSGVNHRLNKIIEISEKESDPS